MGWKDKLKPSVAAFVQEIVDQVPEAAGARNAFELALDQLAGGVTFTHVLVNEDGEPCAVTSDDDLVDRLEDGNTGLYPYEVAKLPVKTNDDFTGDDDDDDDDDDEG